MILFINVYLTNQRGPWPATYNRQNAKTDDKLTVYKYMLASLSHFYPWKKIIINTKLDDYYEPRRKELNDFISEEFIHISDKLIRDYRDERPIEWQQEFDNFNDNLILYLGNHDHIFIDHDLNYFHSIVDEFKNSNEFIAIQFSHWYEQVSYFWQHIGDGQNFKIEDNYLSFDSVNTHAIQIITKEVYYSWWFDKNLPDILFRRSDDDLCRYVQIKPFKMILPYREIARHYDAYGHCDYPFSNQSCPVIEIPNGFFDSNLKINYSSQLKEDMININPCSDKLKIFDNNGFDYNFSKKFIPYFWQSRIKEFKNEFNLDDKSLNSFYVNRILDSWNHMPNTFSNDVVPNIKSKIINAYLEK